MPYVDPSARQKLDAFVWSLAQRIGSVGELNYVITRLVDSYCAADSYSDFNEAIGVLECAKQEMYRRRVARYEDKKMAENGDVYRP